MERPTSEETPQRDPVPANIREALLRIWHRKIRYNRSVTVILVTSILVGVIWFLQQLQNGQLVTTTIYPTYTSLPVGYTSSDISKKNIEISVRMNGLNLLAYMVGSLPLEVDLATVMEKSGDYHFWVPKKHKALLSGVLRENDELANVSADTIFLNMGDETIKNIPVRLSKITIKNKAGYETFSPVTITPPVVRTIGMASEVEAIKEIKLPPLTYKNADDVFYDTITLSPPSGVKRVRFVPEKVVVSFASMPYTEEEIILPIHAVNIPRGKKVKFIPTHVKVKYHVAVKNYGRVEDGNFRIEADLSAAVKESNVIYLTLKTKPSIVGRATIIPEKVYYLLR